MKTTAPDARPDSLKTDPRKVEDAGKKDLKAQGELYVKYRNPLRVHLLGQFRSYPAVLRNWEDLLADFTQKKILSGSSLRMWKPGRGRFRDFLRTSLTNFV